MNDHHEGVITDVLKTARCLFSAVQLGEPCPSNLGYFGGRIEIHQLLVELLRMRHVALVFFKGGRFKELVCFLIGTAQQHQTEGTEYQSWDNHNDPFQASFRRDIFAFV